MADVYRHGCCRHRDGSVNGALVLVEQQVNYELRVTNYE